MRKVLKPIKPFMDKKLDCYQNMLVTLLNYYNCKIDLLGSVWPWQFTYRKIDNRMQIMSKHIATDKNIELLFGFKVIREYFDITMIKTSLIEKLKHGPVIINLDQYYVPHHFVHIYQKEHGQHSLLIVHYNAIQDQFYCVDSFPEYSGVIEYRFLEEGIIQYPFDNVKHQYSTLRKNTCIDVKHEEEVYNDFIESLKVFQANFPADKTFSLPYILQELKRYQTNYNSTYFWDWLNEFLRGTWIWELDRMPPWTIDYLLSQQVKRISKVNEVCEHINICNKMLVSSTRILYKSAIIKSVSNLNRGIELLDETVRMQEKTIALILENK